MLMIHYILHEDVCNLPIKDFSVILGRIYCQHGWHFLPYLLFAEHRQVIAHYKLALVHVLQTVTSNKK